MDPEQPVTPAPNHGSAGSNRPVFGENGAVLNRPLSDKDPKLDQEYRRLADINISPLEIIIAIVLPIVWLVLCGSMIFYGLDPDTARYLQIGGSALIGFAFIWIKKRRSGRR